MVLSQEYVKNEKERDVPWSVSPFKKAQPASHDKEHECDEEGERPPEWLELAGDLAWTTTFASLTSNTTVMEPISVWNYAVFFALTWHLWATQTAYDIKYYTNDWWHRALFASQLAIYAVLAAFSGSFNIGWEIDSDAMEPFTGNSTALTSQTIVENEVTSMEKSFKGVNIILFASRLLLFAQYMRVLWYRRDSKNFWSWRFYLPPAATFAAAMLFLGCYGLVRNDNESKSTAATQLALWAIAIGVQFLAAALTPEDKDGVLKSKSTLPPRMSTLTVIILGKLAVYCTVLAVVFSSFCPSVQKAISILSTEFDSVASYVAATGRFPEHPQLESILVPLKISWQQEVQDLYAAVESAKETGDDPDRVLVGQLGRWLMRVYHGIFILFNEEPDPKAEFEYNKYLSYNDTVIFDDSDNDFALGDKWSDQYVGLMSYTRHWLLAVSGTLLICMALVNIIERRLANRYAWSYSLSRIAIGAILILLGGATIFNEINQDEGGFLPPARFG
ncbi:hypothetical protein FRB90_002264 [Tulasnella sp. 427]|nr:hypothetical protein FRB90_002264 [Tulasnella sp. 427]